jgi:RES domain-containing protein
MPTLLRVVRADEATTDFDGEGSRLYSGRWNSLGTALVHRAQHESLGIPDILVHRQACAPLTAYATVPVEFGDGLAETVDRTALPRNSRDTPAPSALQALGDQWAAEGRSAVLRVPSAIVPREWNYLLNPAHAGFRRLRIGNPEDFRFDTRLRPRP